MSAEKNSGGKNGDKEEGGDGNQLYRRGDRQVRGEGRTGFKKSLMAD